MSSTRPVRRRRSGEEVRTAILTAAEEIFALRGFSGTTTRAVAQQGGVSEALVYKHFGSKAALFEAAVMDRYESFVSGFMDSWAVKDLTTPTSGADLVRGFIASFADFLTDNRNICLSYLDYHRVGPGDATHPAANFALALGDLEDVLRTHRETLGLRDMDVRLTLRAIISMVMGMVLHAEVLFTGLRRPGRERLLSEVTDLVLLGIEER